MKSTLAFILFIVCLSGVSAQPSEEFLEQLKFERDFYKENEILFKKLVKAIDPNKVKYDVDFYNELAKANLLEKFFQNFEKKGPGKVVRALQYNLKDLYKYVNQRNENEANRTLFTIRILVETLERLAKNPKAYTGPDLIGLREVEKAGEAALSKAGSGTVADRLRSYLAKVKNLAKRLG